MKLFELFGVIDLEDNGAEEKIDGVDKKASGLGDTLKKVGGGVATAGKVIGTSMTVAAAGVSAITAKISENTDAIDKGAQNIGFSTDAYQEWDYVLSQSGTSIDTVTGGIAALTEKAVDAANGGEGNIEAFAKLGITMEELQGLSQEEIFEKTIAGLQDMTDKTQRAALASELMGGAGEEMGALLNSTSEDIARMKTEANDLGLVLSEDTVAAGVAMTDSIDQMKRTLVSTLTEAFAPMIPTVMELIKTFVDILPPILDLIKPLIEKLVPVFTKIIDKLLPPLIDLFDALMPVLMPLIDLFVELLDAGLLPLIEALLPLIEVLLPPLTQLLTALTPIITGLAKVLSSVLVVAVNGLSKALTWLFDKMQPVFDMLNKIGDVVGTVFGGLGDLFSGNSSGGVMGFFENIGRAVLPSFDVGTDYVPNDMVAKIHKGERILTAEENKLFMSGVSGNGQQDIVININDAQILNDQAVEEFADRLTGLWRSKGVYA